MKPARLAVNRHIRFRAGGEKVPIPEGKDSESSGVRKTGDFLNIPGSSDGTEI
jgi:hypothetical protein